MQVLFGGSGHEIWVDGQAMLVAKPAADRKEHSATDQQGAR
ncbi:hypothetical protein [Halocynthiibacter namhaensis]